MKRIEPKELSVFSEKDVAIIDVRPSEERSHVRIPNSVSIPYWRFSSGLPQHLNQMAATIGAKSFKTIVLYCGSEALSGMCAEQFPEHMDVRVLTGGMHAWLAANLPVDCDEDLPPVELDRYQPQVRAIGEKAQEKLAKGRVAIIGLGGLGCAAAQYIFGAGIGTVVLIDGDTISESNLHRQTLYSQRDVGKMKVEVAADALTRLNPHVHIVACNQYFVPKLEYLLASCQVVLDCTDSYLSRVAVHVTARQRKVPVVYGAAQRSLGEVAAFGPDGPCYHCFMPESPDVAACMSSGIIGPVCGLVGSLQAMEAIKILSGIGAMSYGTVRRIDMLRGTTIQFDVRVLPSCPHHG